MTPFEPADEEQRRIVESRGDLTVVIGGAGSGKTTCAAAAAHAHLARLPEGSVGRALFLSFSRASVSRITDQSRDILGAHAPRVDVTTFHALAWGLVRRFGRLIGKPAPVLMSPAMSLIYEQGEALVYDDLIPAALDILTSAPAVREHAQNRWGLVIVDEYQDTNDLQEELLQTVAARARLMLLGDPNQCIYSSLPGSHGVSPERLEEACGRAGPDGVVRLPEASYRDPSGVIPAAAAAILRRDFKSAALGVAIESGRLVVRPHLPPQDEAKIVAEAVQDLRVEGQSVAVFSHHNDMLASLSDALLGAGIAHEIAGLSDSLAAALTAQVDMLRFSCGECDWDEVLGSLAVFVTSAVRGQRVPTLAYQILRGTGSAALRSRVQDLQLALEGADAETAVSVAAAAHESVGLPSKITAWQHSAALLRRLYARVSQDRARNLPGAARLRQLAQLASEESIAILTYAADDPQQIQLMNLHQTKGREADATVIVLRERDWFGKEAEPFPEASRLLYVVFTRARRRIVVLLFGQGLPGVVAPLAALGRS